MFEHRSQKPLSGRAFLDRLLRSLGFASLLVAASLGIGMVGYHTTERLPWLDAFLEAAMLLGGMGPVAAPRTDVGKLFAGFYALYCGLVVIAVTGLLLTPVAHRVLHKFHVESTKG